MNLLVIGGTIFLGRRIVEAALVRGHRVSMFSRGRHLPLGVRLVVEALAPSRCSPAERSQRRARAGAAW